MEFSVQTAEVFADLQLAVTLGERPMSWTGMIAAAKATE
jgi:hypothetical protein